jgi:hypothetical protein
MPAVTGDEDEPDEQTREYAEGEAGDTMVVPPGEIEARENSSPGAVGPDSRRVRLVLLAVVVLAIVAALVIWWLSR